MLPQVKDHVKSLETDAKAARADATRSRAQVTVLEIENKGLRDAAELRKRKRTGFTVTNIGTHIYTTEAVLRQAVTVEATAASRKRKLKGTAVPGGWEGAVGDVARYIDGLDQI